MRLVERAERPEEPAEGRGIGTFAEAPEDAEPARRLAELPAEVPEPAEPALVESPRLLDPPGLKRVVDRLLDQVERRLVLGQPAAGASREADELLADQVVPTAAAGLVAEPGEVVADRRVDADRAVGLAEHQMEARQRRDRTPDRVGVEPRQRPGQGPLPLPEPAGFPDADEHSVLQDVEPTEPALDAAEPLAEVVRAEVFGQRWKRR